MPLDQSTKALHTQAVEKSFSGGNTRVSLTLVTQWRDLRVRILQQYLVPRI
jgi:hypothetical protein